MTELRTEVRDNKLIIEIPLDQLEELIAKHSLGGELTQLTQQAALTQAHSTYFEPDEQVSIEVLLLPTLVRNKLKYKEVKTVAELKATPVDELLEEKCIGEHGVTMIKKQLHEFHSGVLTPPIEVRTHTGGWIVPDFSTLPLPKDMSLNALELCKRIVTILDNKDIYTVEHLLKTPPEELLEFEGLSRKSIVEILTRLEVLRRKLELKEKGRVFS